MADPATAFTRGALGHSLQVLTQRFHGAPKGGRGGGMEWTRRAMLPGELYRVGLAVGKAAEMIDAALGEPIITPPEADTLAAIEDEDQAEAQIVSWIAEAELELERRRQLGEEELQRRRAARSW